MPLLHPFRDTPSRSRHLTEDLLEARCRAAIFRDARAVALNLRANRAADRVRAAAARVRRLLTKVYDDHSWQPRDWHGRFAEMAEGATPASSLLGNAAPSAGDNSVLNESIQVAGLLEDFPISLEAEEALGGHTIDKHVGKSDTELLYQAAEQITKTGGKVLKRGVRASTFETIGDANSFVNLALAMNFFKVAMVQIGLPKAEITQNLGVNTGREIFFLL